MTKMHTTLLLLLIASLVINIYQYTERIDTTTIYLPERDTTEGLDTKREEPVEQENPDANNSLDDLLARDQSYQIESKQHITEKFTLDRREAYLAQTQHWLAAQEYAKIDEFLPLYLRQHPQDIDFLLLEAEYIIHTSLLSDAIIHYQSLLSLPLSTAQQEQVQQTVTRLTEETIVQLKQANSWDILAQFVEPLLQVSPTSRSLILALATAYARQQQANLMENVLASIRYDDPQAMRIRQLIERTDQSITESNRDSRLSEPFSDSSRLSAGTRIALQKYGDQYVVPTRLSGHQVNFLIDTGASTTAISRQKFKQLFKTTVTKFVGQFNVQTANGTVRSPMYQFASLEIANVHVKNINIMVLPLDELAYSDGLLGMNFLREFDFRIDQQNAQLYLR